MTFKLKKEEAADIDPRAYDMAAIIMDMREYFLYLPVDSGFFSFKYAFDVNPFSNNAQDLGRIQALSEISAWRKFLKNDRLGMYAMWACIGIGIMVLGIYVLGKMVF